MTTATLKPSADAIRKWLEDVINDPDSRRRVLIRAALELKDRYIVYPPAGPWNREPGVNNSKHWYQRKFGSRWRKMDGTIGGNNTSQDLQVSWRHEINADAYSASVFTDVTYAPYLYDPEQRVHWAASHGWEDTNEIADNFMPRFEELVSDEIDAQIERQIE